MVKLIEQCIMYLSCCYGKIPDRSNLREGLFWLTV